MKILANDGLHPQGIDKLRAAGFEVDTDKVAQDDLPEKLPAYDVILVRSATKVRQALIDQCPNLKIIGRGGVGLDNIDVDYARSKGIEVMNTPAASSRSVAELAIAHLFSIQRSLHLANRDMPHKGQEAFKQLKKEYAKSARELQGLTMGIIGFGRIGQETARLALGLGMQVVASDLSIREADIDIDIAQAETTVTVHIDTLPLEDLLRLSDVISLHVPFTGKALLGTEEMARMKDGVILINAARGGTIDEDALLAALDSGKVAAAGLDVFANEPTPRADLLSHPQVSLSPHIGGSTTNAQSNIGLELADKIIAYFKK